MVKKWEKNMSNVSQTTTSDISNYVRPSENTSLDKILPRLSNLTVKIKEFDKKIIFLHKIVEGKANHSFGIEVAKLAGIPLEVIERSKSILVSLKTKSKNKSFDLNKQFISEKVEKETNEQTVRISKAEDLIKSLNVDEITPKEALHILYKLKSTIL